ncbi:MAG: hypothetical protein A4S09_10910 [Proteobacteria bacterium SG_bin7]|nr:MAG: hypothetical protein A4S09_10910 [Proteobacteria bacterium SG_bin7]
MGKFTLGLIFFVSFGFINGASAKGLFLSGTYVGKVEEFNAEISFEGVDLKGGTITVVTDCFLNAKACTAIDKIGGKGIKGQEVRYLKNISLPFETYDSKEAFEWSNSYYFVGETKDGYFVVPAFTVSAESQSESKIFLKFVGAKGEGSWFTKK